MGEDWHGYLVRLVGEQRGVHERQGWALPGAVVAIEAALAEIERLRGEVERLREVERKYEALRDQIALDAL